MPGSLITMAGARCHVNGRSGRFNHKLLPFRQVCIIQLLVSVCTDYSFVRIAHGARDARPKRISCPTTQTGLLAWQQPEHTHRDRA